jgi:energy-converting hydrogenase Eha subunit B
MTPTLKGRGYIGGKVEATGGGKIGGYIGGKVKATGGRKGSRLKIRNFRFWVIGTWCFEFVWNLMLVTCDLLNM